MDRTPKLSNPIGVIWIEGKFAISVTAPSAYRGDGTMPANRVD
jgi:hypothetical protein